MKNLAESLEFEQSKNFKREDYYFDFPQKYTPRSVVLNSSNLSSMIEQSEKLSQPNSHRAPNQVKLKFNIQTRKFTEIPIEDKLFQKQMAAKTRLENLRQLREQEQLKCLQNKPKISKRSQELAKQAENRLYQQICMQVEGEKPSQLPKFETETFIHKQDFLKNFEETPEIIKSGTPMKSTNRPEKETHFSIQTPFFKETQENQKPATPKRVASLKIKINPESCRNRSQSISSPKKIQLNLTVIERNEA